MPTISLVIPVTIGTEVETLMVACLLWVVVIVGFDRIWTRLLEFTALTTIFMSKVLPVARWLTTPLRIFTPPVFEPLPKPTT